MATFSQSSSIKIRACRPCRRLESALVRIARLTSLSGGREHIGKSRWRRSKAATETHTWSRWGASLELEMKRRPPKAEVAGRGIVPDEAATAAYVRKLTLDDRCQRYPGALACKRPSVA